MCSAQAEPPSVRFGTEAVPPPCPLPVGTEPRAGPVPPALGERAKPPGRPTPDRAGWDAAAAAPAGTRAWSSTLKTQTYSPRWMSVRARLVLMLMSLYSFCINNQLQ